MVVGRKMYHHLIENLDSSKEYYVRLNAYNSVGYSPWKATFPSKIKPTPYVPSIPTSVTLTLPTTSSITGHRENIRSLDSSVRALNVTWFAPVSVGGSPIEKYQIEWDQLDSFDSQCGDQIEKQQLKVTRTDDSVTGSNVKITWNGHQTSCLDWKDPSAMEVATLGDIHVLKSHETLESDLHCRWIFPVETTGLVPIPCDLYVTPRYRIICSSDFQLLLFYLIAALAVERIKLIPFDLILFNWRATDTYRSKPGDI
jgi:hypothetical protein